MKPQSAACSSSLTPSWRIPSFVVVLIFLLTAGLVAQSQQFEGKYLLPSRQIQDLLTRDNHRDSLQELSPDGRFLMIPIQENYSTLELMSQKTYRLGMLELNPDVNREWRLNTYGIKGLKVFDLEQRSSRRIGLPSGTLISGMTWSPDGQRIAFLAHLDRGTQVWTADPNSGEANPLGEAYVMATLSGRQPRGRAATAPSSMLQWTPDGGVITLLVPSNRGPEPAQSRVPGSPIIRRTRDKPTPTPTYPFLLRTQHDQQLFKYYTTSQLALLRPGQSPRNLGTPAQYVSISSSPDGQNILVEKVVEPYSFIVSHTNFARDLQVLNMNGRVLSTIRRTPLREVASQGRGRNPALDLPREVAWRPDGKGLSMLWLEAKTPGDEEEADSENSDRQDQLMTLAAPFNMNRIQTLAATEESLSSLAFSEDGNLAFVTRAKGGKQDIAAYDLTSGTPQVHILAEEFDPEEPLALPGEVLTKWSGNGVAHALLSSDGRSAYLKGDGYRADFHHRPFVDRVEISTGSKQRVFEGASRNFEQPLIPLNVDLTEIVISRESKTQFPDNYLWKSDGSTTKLTNNSDPYPEVAAAERVDFEFTRRDGLKIQARIALPPNYRRGTRVPAVFWTYPREYETFDKYQNAAITSRNQNAFPHLNSRNASEIWLTQGYAVVVPDIPIIGKGNTYNNNYIAHLVDSMYAAIRKVDQLGYVDVDRMGHGGHSYGAFATANILARTPFFKAGIAGDGAFNRSLTPMTFQRERRYLWEAQDTILEMSPFFSADHLDTPLLMYHGAVDNNTGTFLIQSERLIQALTGLGKTAALYIYPYESHGPRAMETYMDMWVRWLGWFDRYVKSGSAEMTDEGPRAPN